MAFSSLVFGGLSLWHARQSKESILESSDVSSMLQRFLDWLQLALFRLVDFAQSIDPRTTAWLISTLCLLTLLGE
jgi:hypothetical protein